MAWGKSKSERSSKELRLANDGKKEANTGEQLKEAVFNKVVDRYTKKGREFEFSDVFVWKGAIFIIPEFVGYILFFMFFLFLAQMSFKYYGEPRTYVFVMLLIMWRANMILKQLSQINKKL